MGRGGKGEMREGKEEINGGEGEGRERRSLSYR